MSLKGRVKLAEYFNKLGFKKGAEIGVAKGKFSQVLCEKIPGLTLFCIDPWLRYSLNRRSPIQEKQIKAYEEAQQRLKDYNVTFIRKFSLQAAQLFENESLDFVFIDGNHDYDFVMEDVINWTRKVRKGGIVSGHDYYNFNNSGVIEAVNDYTKYHNIKLNLTEGGRHNPRDDKKPSWWFVKS